jgi:glyoxylase-like metal-dependent hydrolase (beta-lactamase superfamily II)
MHTPTIPEVLAHAGVSLLERGWLSANNALIRGGEGPTALVDSGYGSHAPQTMTLVLQALEGRRLDLLLNTHLHSDHCGGNAALQAHFPSVRTLIPPGSASAVSAWDEVALTYAPTGQKCPRFHFSGVLQPGTALPLGPSSWEVHAAKGHDPHAIVLFQPDHRLLLSADALWKNGFGVVFPELEGVSAFDEVADTLDLIEALDPLTVIPGHGTAFQDIAPALHRARSRLQQFRDSPEKHLRHAQKVLIKFRLLEWQRIERAELLRWAKGTPYLRQSMPDGDDTETAEWMDQLLIELERSAALKLDGAYVANC